VNVYSPRPARLPFEPDASISDRAAAAVTFLERLANFAPFIVSTSAREWKRAIPHRSGNRSMANHTSAPSINISFRHLPDGPATPTATVSPRRMPHCSAAMYPSEISDRKAPSRR